jgi:hypothetical protein
VAVVLAALALVLSRREPRAAAARRLIGGALAAQSRPRRDARSAHPGGRRRQAPLAPGGCGYRCASMSQAVKTTVTELPQSRVRVDVEVAPEEVARA